MTYITIGGALIGALIPTFLLSRLFLWLLRKIPSNTQLSAIQLIVAHVCSGALSCTLAAFGYADGGNLNWFASIFYIAAQILWLIVDLIRGYGRAKSVAIPE